MMYQRVGGLFLHNVRVRRTPPAIGKTKQAQRSLPPAPCPMRCNRCHRPMPGTTPSDGACECGGLIEHDPDHQHEWIRMEAFDTHADATPTERFRCACGTWAWRKGTSYYREQKDWPRAYAVEASRLLERDRIEGAEPRTRRGPVTAYPRSAGSNAAGGYLPPGASPRARR